MWGDHLVLSPDYWVRTGYQAISWLTSDIQVEHARDPSYGFSDAAEWLAHQDDAAIMILAGKYRSRHLRETLQWPKYNFPQR